MIHNNNLAAKICYFCVIVQQLAIYSSHYLNRGLIATTIADQADKTYTDNTDVHNKLSKTDTDSCWQSWH